MSNVVEFPQRSAGPRSVLARKRDIKEMISIAAQTPLEDTPIAIVVVGIMEDGHARTVVVGLEEHHRPDLREACEEISRTLQATG